jgi:RNA polymerase sigma-70 factor (sigma-E family)
MDGFEEFARARTPQLYRTAWLLTGDPQLAEDLVQETLTRIYARFRKLDNPAAYARTVLVRRYVTQRRRRSASELPAETVPEQAATDSDPTLRVVLRNALAELPALDRAVLVLRFFDDCSVEQVAIELGCSAGAVRTRTSRALTRLRGVLGDDLTVLAES